MCRDKNGLTEEEFLKSYNPDKYPKPSLTADICIFAHSDVTEILLVKRGGHPYIGNGHYLVASLIRMNRLKRRLQENLKKRQV